MATKKFGREPKIKTTEPSVDEVGRGMKKGGGASKKSMLMGGSSTGMPVGSALMSHKKGGKASGGLFGGVINGVMNGAVNAVKNAVGSGNQTANSAKGLGGVMAGMANSAKGLGGVMAGMGKTRPPMKRGGKAEGGESKAAHKGEMNKMNKIEKELKHHEGMKASKAHAGLKKGGMTGGIEGPGYKNGGTLSPAIDVNDKVVEAKQRKSISSKTGALEGAGYKHGGRSKKHFATGGSVAGRYLNDMKDGEKIPTKKAGTGEIKQTPAGYKDGGHVSHSTTQGHGDHGHQSMHKTMPKADHDLMEGHTMKSGGKAHKTTKMSTHHKKGGKCNY